MNKAEFSNQQVSQLFRNIAAAQLLKGHNRFRIIAYEKAADAIEHLSREIYDVWKEGKLMRVSGIGANIGQGLDEYFSNNGTSKHFDSIMEGIPPSVFLLMQVPGIGPKKAYKLVMKFELVDKKTVVKELKKIAKQGKIAQVEGFGPKSEADIVQALEIFERQDKREKRIPLTEAITIAHDIITYLKQHKLVERVDVLGSLRRRVSTIGDVDIAVEADLDNAPDIVKYFLAYPANRKTEAAGGQKASMLVAENVRVDLRVQPRATYGAMLQYFTGSKAHNIQLREHALRKGYTLNEHGIKDMKHETRNMKQKNKKKTRSPTRVEDDIHQFGTEEELYGFLGLQYIPPEIREGGKEIELAQKNQIPTLIQHSDIKGDFHMHSDYDLQPSHDKGKNTYEEMMKKAQELGYAYIGFSEHNPKQKGLSDEDIVTIMKERKYYIDHIFTPTNLPYFIGLEVDILPSGDIALPSSAIDYVDYLIVSLHSSFRMNRADMTKRVLKALSQPKVKIFGHPTGRMLGKRDGVELDWDQVFSYVLEHNIALEINSGPPRLDLPDSLVKEGKEKGCTFFINTDAHAVEHMDWMSNGVFVARRGWLEASDVVNTWSYNLLKKWLLS